MFQTAASPQRSPLPPPKLAAIASLALLVAGLALLPGTAAAALAAGAPGTGAAAGGGGAAQPPRKLVILGFDGADAKLTERWMDEGKLPQPGEAAPRRAASRRCCSTIPSQTPVSWSTFSTGLNPGRHGIFDFLKRDPQTYQPELRRLRRASASRSCGATRNGWIVGAIAGVAVGLLALLVAVAGASSCADCAGRLARRARSPCASCVRHRRRGGRRHRRRPSAARRSGRSPSTASAARPSGRSSARPASGCG